MAIEDFHFASAPIYGLGPTTDVLALALEDIGVHARATLAQQWSSHELSFAGELSPAGSEGVSEGAPTQSAQSPALAAARRLVSQLSRQQGRSAPCLEVFTQTQVPLRQGLGASAAAAAAGALAASKALSQAGFGPASDSDLLEAACFAERLVSGFPNVHACASALFGGAAIAFHHHKREFRTLALPRDWHVLVTLPEWKMTRKDWRSHLPERVHFKKMTQHLGRAVGVALAIGDGDPAQLRANDEDRIVEHALGPHLPGAFPILGAMRSSGAMLAGFSGTGPALAGVFESSESAEQARSAVTQCAAQHVLSHQSAVFSLAAVRSHECSS